MTAHQEITYTDELLSDRTVHRRYSDGRHEWRRQVSSRLVEWRDDRGQQGTDELLGRNILKRTCQNAYTLYGRDLGYGRTAWRHHPGHWAPAGTSGLAVTVNRTSFGGRVGTILSGVGAGMLLGPVIAPPAELTADQEEELRRAAAQQSSSGGDSGGGDGGGWWDGDDSGSFDDFG